MSGHRRRILRAVQWAGVVIALAAGVTLAVMDHLLAASAVLVGSAVPLAALSWATDPPAKGREDPRRLWQITRIQLIASAPVALAGIVLLLARQSTLGTPVLIAGIAMAASGAFLRYTVRMDHRDMPDDPAPRVQRQN